MAKKIQCDICMAIFDPEDSRGNDIAGSVYVSVPKDSTNVRHFEIRKQWEVCQDCGRNIAAYVQNRKEEFAKRNA